MGHWRSMHSLVQIHYEPGHCHETVQTFWQDKEIQCAGLLAFQSRLADAVITSRSFHWPSTGEFIHHSYLGPIEAWALGQEGLN